MDVLIWVEVQGKQGVPSQVQALGADFQSNPDSSTVFQLV